MNEIVQLNTLLRRVLLGFKPPENLTVSQWAGKHRRLSSETAAEPGRWRTPICGSLWMLSTIHGCGAS